MTEPKVFVASDSELLSYYEGNKYFKYEIFNYLLKVPLNWDGIMEAKERIKPYSFYHSDTQIWSFYKPKYERNNVTIEEITKDLIYIFNPPQEILDEIIKPLKPKIIKREIPDIPIKTSIKLKPFQKKGVQFIVSRKNSMLADEMGLGKTVQAIATIEHLNLDKILVIVPASIKVQWGNEIKKFTKLTYTIISGPPKKRQKLWKEPTQIKIINYELLLRDKEPFETKWDLVILDEVQRIKNWKSKTSSMAKKIKADRKLVLTGTPIMNRPEELYNIFDFLQPNFLGTFWNFRDRYIQYRKTRWGTEITGYKNLDELNKRIQPLFLRRRTSEVRTELPPYKDFVYTVELYPSQQKIYKSILKCIKQKLASTTLLKMASLSNHLLQLSESKLLGKCNIKISDTKSSKLDELVKIIEDIGIVGSKTNKEDYCLIDHTYCKIVIFTQFKRMLDIIKERLEKEGYKVASVFGGMKQEERQKQIELFTNTNEYNIIVGTDAIGEGVNLQVANYLLHFDLPWNPSKLQQRTARIYRIGQQNMVNIIYLIAENTIELRILEILQEKKDLFDQLIEGKEVKGLMDSIKRYLEGTGVEYEEEPKEIEEIEEEEIEEEIEEKPEEIEEAKEIIEKQPLPELVETIDELSNIIQVPPDLLQCIITNFLIEVPMAFEQIKDDGHIIDHSHTTSFIFPTQNLKYQIPDNPLRKIQNYQPIEVSQDIINKIRIQNLKESILYGLLPSDVFIVPEIKTYFYNELLMSIFQCIYKHIQNPTIKFYGKEGFPLKIIVNNVYTFYIAPIQLKEEPKQKLNLIGLLQFFGLSNANLKKLREKILSIELQDIQKQCDKLYDYINKLEIPIDLPKDAFVEYGNEKLNKIGEYINDLMKNTNQALIKKTENILSTPYLDFTFQLPFNELENIIHNYLKERKKVPPKTKLITDTILDITPKLTEFFTKLKEKYEELKQIKEKIEEDITDQYKSILAKYIPKEHIDLVNQIMFNSEITNPTMKPPNIIQLPIAYKGKTQEEQLKAILHEIGHIVINIIEPDEFLEWTKIVKDIYSPILPIHYSKDKKDTEIFSEIYSIYFLDQLDSEWIKILIPKSKDREIIINFFDKLFKHKEEYEEEIEEEITEIPSPYEYSKDGFFDWYDDVFHKQKGIDYQLTEDEKLIINALYNCIVDPTDESKKDELWEYLTGLDNVRDEIAEITVSFFDKLLKKKVLPKPEKIEKDPLFTEPMGYTKKDLENWIDLLSSRSISLLKEKSPFALHKDELAVMSYVQSMYEEPENKEFWIGKYQQTIHSPNVRESIRNVLTKFYNQLFKKKINIVEIFPILEELDSIYQDKYITFYALRNKLLYSESQQNEIIQQLIDEGYIKPSKGAKENEYDIGFTNRYGKTFYYFKITDKFRDFIAITKLGEEPKKPKKKKKQRFKKLEEVWIWLIENVKDTDLPVSIEKLGLKRKDLIRLESYGLVKLDKPNEFIHTIYRDKPYQEVRVIWKKDVSAPAPEGQPNQIQIRCPVCNAVRIHPNSKQLLTITKFYEPTDDKTKAKYVLYHRGGKFYKKGEKDPTKSKGSTGRVGKSQVIGMYMQAEPELPLMKQWLDRIGGLEILQENQELKKKIAKLQNKLDEIINKTLPIVEGKTKKKSQEFIEEIKRLNQRIKSLEKQLERTKKQKTIVVRTMFKPGEEIDISPLVEKIKEYLRTEDPDREWADGIRYENNQLVVSNRLVKGTDTEIDIERLPDEIGIVHYHPVDAHDKFNLTINDIRSIIMEKNVLDVLVAKEIEEPFGPYTHIKFYFLDPKDISDLQANLDRTKYLRDLFNQRVKHFTIELETNPPKKITVPKR